MSDTDISTTNEPAPESEKVSGPGCAVSPGSGSSPRIVDAMCSCCMWSGRTPENDLACPECGEDLRVDDRKWNDWCKAQGWDDCQDCPECGGSGQYDDCTPCDYCDGEGSIDW